ncbi:hypothetical protein MCW_00547 [Cardidatus Bartonella washoeensis 085-0475]|uniref:Uncharacterized protein n=1 Tax=Cardidatus Bartonella washoeensis 085-0475 TaxID=1094564 RepID=J0ZDI5_9HYPH|nr:hypothetical protein MCW_00547 [Bartonella washoeensis 085-0475]
MVHLIVYKFLQGKKNKTNLEIIEDSSVKHGWMYYQIPSSTLALWEKPGKDRAVIEQALLKCRWKSVYSSPSDMNPYASEFASVYECIKKAVYRYKL